MALPREQARPRADLFVSVQETATMPRPHPQSAPTALPRPTAIPYVVRRTDELGVSETALTTRPKGGGLCYRGERPGDRDAHGALWARVSLSRGRGRPVFNEMHPARQRACMESLLCQVCGQLASTTPQGTLFLDARPNRRPARWPEGHVTALPPLCVTCVPVTVEQCHYFAHTRAVALRARNVRPWGVGGALYGPGPGGSVRPMGGDTVNVAYTHPYLRWVLASQTFVQLTCTTVINLADL